MTHQKTEQTSWRVLLPHLIAIAVFFVVNLIFFYPQLEGKVTVQGDIQSYVAASKELKDYKEQDGHQPLWTNSMFSGMPSYAISMDRSSNRLLQLRDAIGLWIQRPIGYFFVMMLSMYVLFIVLGISPWIAIIGAVAAGLSTNNFILWDAGHSNKLKVLSYIGFIIAGLISTYRGKYLKGGLLFMLGMALALFANHPQMLYYLGLSLLIYVLLVFIDAIKQKQYLHFIKSSLVLLVATVIAIGANVDNLWTLYDYNKDTMRGHPILHQAAMEGSSSNVKGLDWEYAMQWSNGWLDNFSSFIPGIVGGSSQEPVSSKGALNQFMRKNGGQHLKLAPLYWGSLPFTSGPPYFGAVIWFFFLLGLFLEKGRLKWWIGISVLLTFMLAMGKHLAFFNHLLFDYLPLFNNFRTPNSVLSVTAFLMPVLSVLSLQGIYAGRYKKEEIWKWTKISFGILGGVALLLAVAGPFILSFEGAGDAQFRGDMLDAIIKERQLLLRKDAFKAFLFVLLSAGLVWAYLNAKLNKMQLVLFIAVLTLIDMGMEAKRYFGTNKFVPPTRLKSNFSMRPVDKEILTDKSLYYRVHDMTRNPFNSSLSSYYHKTIGGYSAAKLQRYQDLIEHHISRGNEKVLNMLNMRYLIDKTGKAHFNPAALGNAWMVQKIITVPGPDEEIAALKTFDPKTEAVMEQSFAEKLHHNTAFSAKGFVNLTSYHPDRLLYDFNSSENQFVVFSEIWYDKGWKAYIDNVEVPIYKVNYALRGVLVPPGRHAITLKFEPEKVLSAFKISSWFSYLVLAGFLLLIALMIPQVREKLKFLPD